MFHRYSHQLELPAGAPFEALEWQTSGRDLIMRPRDGALDMAWIYLERARLAAKLLQPRTLRTARNKVVGAINSPCVWRAWPLGAGETVLMRAEFGLLQREGETELVRFEVPRGSFSSARAALTASGAVVRALVEKWQSDDNSELNAARRWRETHRDPWAVLRFERGTRAELEALLGALAIICLDLQQPNYWSWVAQTNVHGRLDWHDLFFPTTFRGGWPAPAFEPIKCAVEAHFDVRLTDEPWRAYDSSGEPAPLRLPRLRLVQPTMHEKLEAALHARAWLQDKISPDELTAFEAVYIEP